MDLFKPHTLGLEMQLFTKQETGAEFTAVTRNANRRKPQCYLSQGYFSFPLKLGITSQSSAVQKMPMLNLG